MGYFKLSFIMLEVGSLDVNFGIIFMDNGRGVYL
jgi:hypothetical protein